MPPVRFENGGKLGREPSDLFDSSERIPDDRLCFLAHCQRPQLSPEEIQERKTKGDTKDGWVELCGMRIGVWVREAEQTFETVYFRGYFGGASDPIVLNEDDNTMEGLSFGCGTESLERIVVQDWRR